MHTTFNNVIYSEYRNYSNNVAVISITLGSVLLERS